METLQQAIEKLAEAIPSLFFEKLISKKLEAQGITASKKLSKKIAEHLLSRSNEPFKYRSRKPLSARVQQRITKQFDKAVARYGKPFKTDYGWAASHLKKDRPAFADLEEAAGRADMRSYYQMGNDNIHAGIKSMFFRLGLLGDDNGAANRTQHRWTGRAWTKHGVYVYPALCSRVPAWQF